MKTLSKYVVQTATSELPHDLTVWFDEPSLMKMTSEIVRGIPWLPFERLCSSENRDCPPQLLMTVIIYCYTRGMSNFQEIECALEREDGLRSLFLGRPPDVDALRRFRHIHRDRVVQTLAQVLERAWEFHGGTVSKTTAGESSLGNSLVGAGKLADRPDFRLNAVERVQHGLFLDCIAQDI